MAGSVDEWFRQADYDLETAECMLQNDRRFYAAFMAHLAVEKALKGLYRRKLGKGAPKTHNLPYLLECMGLAPPPGRAEFLADLTAAQVVTRYAEDMAKLQRAFPAAKVREILDLAGEVIQWARTQP